jgi:hypothetical protein
MMALMLLCAAGTAYSASYVEHAEAIVTLQVQAPATGSLRVTVTNVNGIVISNAYVASTVQPNGQSELNGITNSAGVVTFTDILVGDYTIQASSSGYVSVSSKVSVTAGTTTVLNFTLRSQQSEGGGGIPGYPFEAVALVILLFTFWLWIRNHKQ